MRIPIKKPIHEKAIVVDLKLRDGLVVDRIAIDANGEILGKVVGGQAGLDESPLPFCQDDVIAYRRRGLAARLGIAPWQNT